MDDDVSKVKPFLLNSIARFLESNGFSSTLKKFRSEAHFEEDDAKNPTMDLGEMFLKFMGSTNDAVTSDATKQDAENKPKYKKKKASNSTEVEVEEFKKDAENSTVDSKSALNPSEGPVEHYNAEKKSKDKKKKASRSSDLEVQSCGEEEKNSTDNGKPFLDDRGGHVKDEDKNSNKAVAGKENKATKKRKRNRSKDCETRSVKGDTVEESRPNDTDVTEELQTEKKKLKASINTEKSGGLETITNKGHDLKIQEVFGHFTGADKSVEKAGEKSSSQKSMTKQNGSAESKPVKSCAITYAGFSRKTIQSLKKQLAADPTSAKAFQRIKVEEVVFSDERLKDNSYWAKDGAETGYGAKAQEVLGQVRGRDFRHEKTKKKRGSYRGGQIDLQSHSVKFNYSDDE